MYKILVIIILTLNYTQAKMWLLNLVGITSMFLCFLFRCPQNFFFMEHHQKTQKRLFLRKEISHIKQPLVFNNYIYSRSL